MMRDVPTLAHLEDELALLDREDGKSVEAALVHCQDALRVVKERYHGRAGKGRVEQRAIAYAALCEAEDALLAMRRCLVFEGDHKRAAALLPAVVAGLRRAWRASPS